MRLICTFQHFNTQHNTLLIILTELNTEGIDKKMLVSNPELQLLNSNTVFNKTERLSSYSCFVNVCKQELEVTLPSSHYSQDFWKAFTGTGNLKVLLISWNRKRILHQMVLLIYKDSFHDLPKLPLLDAKKHTKQSTQRDRSRQTKWSQKIITKFKLKGRQ